MAINFKSTGAIIIYSIVSLGILAFIGYNYWGWFRSKNSITVKNVDWDKKTAVVNIKSGNIGGDSFVDMTTNMKDNTANGFVHSVTGDSSKNNITIAIYKRVGDAIGDTIKMTVIDFNTGKITNLSGRFGNDMSSERAVGGAIPITPKGGDIIKIHKQTGDIFDNKGLIGNIKNWTNVWMGDTGFIPANYFPIDLNNPKSECPYGFENESFTFQLITSKAYDSNYCYYKRAGKSTAP